MTRIHWWIALVSTSVALVACRFGIATILEPDRTPLWAAAINANIRLLVLVGLAILLAKLPQQQRELAKRVQTLERIVPICSFCKKIRLPDGKWEPIETYIGHRSATQFSHSFCEDCGREHYGEYLSPPDSVATEPGSAPDHGHWRFSLAVSPVRG